MASSPRHAMTAHSAVPTSANASRHPAGPPLTSAVPVPKKKPVPTVPPMAMKLRWRPESWRRRAALLGLGLVLLFSFFFFSSSSSGPGGGGLPPSPMIVSVVRLVGLGGVSFFFSLTAATVAVATAVGEEEEGEST